MGRESISRMVCGREFQRRKAARLKALDPIHNKQAGGAVRGIEEED